MEGFFECWTSKPGEILGNILSNASKHEFKDSKKQKYKIKPDKLYILLSFIIAIHTPLILVFNDNNDI